MSAVPPIQQELSPAKAGQPRIGQHICDDDRSAAIAESREKPSLIGNVVPSHITARRHEMRTSEIVAVALTAMMMLGPLALAPAYGPYAAPGTAEKVDNATTPLSNGSTLNDPAMQQQ